MRKIICKLTYFLDMYTAYCLTYYALIVKSFLKIIITLNIKLSLPKF